ncbi:unnamed protein product [Symbiodinium sp. CCMP2456]|nr:unnamed protein product [Symbiodinium sp. CCMP2456]
MARWSTVSIKSWSLSSCQAFVRCTGSDSCTAFVESGGWALTFCPFCQPFETRGRSSSSPPSVWPARRMPT